MLLSKSDFKTARSCPTKLYYRKRGYPSLADGDEYLAFLAECASRLNVIASMLGLPARTVSQVTEPFLIRAGLIVPLRQAGTASLKGNQAGSPCRVQAGLWTDWR